MNYYARLFPYTGLYAYLVLQVNATDRGLLLSNCRICKSSSTAEYNLHHHYSNHGKMSLVGKLQSVRESFLYFAYGSNLWSERIRLNNRSARFKAIGRLEVSELLISSFVVLSSTMEFLPGDSIESLGMTFFLS